MSADASLYTVRLVGFPVAFNSAGTAEGPLLDFGMASAAAGHLFPVPETAGYGPYSLIAVLESVAGPAWLSDAAGMVLRSPGMFPLFRQAAQGVRPRRTCCESRFLHHTADLRALKDRVRNMPPDAMARLKGLLDVDVLVFYSQGP